MDHPLFMNNCAAPLRHRYHHPHPPSPAKALKVVSIPIHFVGSEADRRPIDQSAAAIRIQKAARGFLVRKNMRTVRKIAAEAEGIARWIETSAEQIRRDDRERIRVGEMLMALLLRLDSVRGVRDYRKMVIRRVIQLQEAVDSVATNTYTAAAEEATESEATMMEESKADDTGESGVDRMDEVPECAWAEEEEEEEEVAAMEEPPKAEAEQEEMSVGTTGGGPQGLKLAVEELVGLKEVMERSATESERLKGLVAVLCERSAQQCELMNGLVKRVEQLERRVQSMERKKRRQAAATTNHALTPKKKK